MVFRSRWVRTAGMASVVALAGAAFAGCGDDGEESDDGDDVATEEAEGEDTAEAEGSEQAVTEAAPEDVDFCDAFMAFEMAMIEELDSSEDVDEAGYFGAVRDNFEDLASVDPVPEAIADDWATWTEATAGMYEQLAEASDAESSFEDLMSEADEAYTDAETAIMDYRDTSCPMGDPGTTEGAEDGAEAEEPEADGAEAE